MQGNKTYILVLAFLAFSMLGKAQTNCIQNLRDARNYYEDGKLNLLPDLLVKCINNGFSKEEKIEALRLLTLAYLFNEEERKAEASFLQLLKINPEYAVNQETEPTELVILSERYDTDPKFFFGVKIVGGYSFIQITENNFNSNLVQPGTYTPPINFGGGIYFQYPINDDFSANLEAYYLFRSTELNRPLVSAEGSSSNFHTISEDQQYLEIPLLVNYKIPYVNKFLLEVTGGPGFHYLTSSQMTLEGLGQNRNDLDMLSYRNLFNMSGILGLRANFKVLGKGYLTVETLYQYRFLNEVIKTENSLKDDFIKGLESNSQYIENQYKGHAILLRVGVRFPYFKPALK